jgi:hypothetical protein
MPHVFERFAVNENGEILRSTRDSISGPAYGFLDCRHGAGVVHVGFELINRALVLLYFIQTQQPQFTADVESRV